MLPSSSGRSEKGVSLRGCSSHNLFTRSSESRQLSGWKVQSEDNADPAPKTNHQNGFLGMCSERRECNDPGDDQRHECREYQGQPEPVGHTDIMD